MCGSGGSVGLAGAGEDGVGVSLAGEVAGEEAEESGAVERREEAIVRRMWDSVDRVAVVTHAVRHISFLVLTALRAFFPAMELGTRDGMGRQGERTRTSMRATPVLLLGDEALQADEGAARFACKC